MKTVKIALSGLGCANCAAKIEDSIAGLDYVESASLNFASSLLTVTLSDGAPASALSEMQSTAKKVEETVVFAAVRVGIAEEAAPNPADSLLPEQSEPDHSHEHEHGHNHGAAGSEKVDLILLIAAAVIAGVSFFLPVSQLVKNIMLASAVLLAGYRVFWQGVKGLLKLRLDEDILLAVAAVAACVLGEFSEAAFVTILFRAGLFLEDYAVAKSRKSIKSLTEIRPETANLLKSTGEACEVSAKRIPIGSSIIIKPGERVPLDCVVTAGSSEADASAITGESVPVPVSEGSALLSGTVNGKGLLTCRTTATFNSSAASRIIELVEESAAKKGKTEKLITRFARWYTPAIILAAVALSVVPPLLGGGDFAVWVQRALVFLVASCPCALVISVPLGFFAAVGAQSKIGVLVKGGVHIEALSKADCVAFDKTGTLTTGKLMVTEVRVLDNELCENDIVHLAAVCESYSTHPAAKAVMERYGKTILKSTVSSVEEIAGMGVRAVYGGTELLCGSERLMHKNNILISGLEPSNIYLARGGSVIGQIFVSDTPKASAVYTVKALKSVGVKQVAMLTGDNETAAGAVAAECGTDSFKAGLMPSGKVDEVEKLKREYTSVLFVGDGINDAPVLASADCGVAMGLGTDAAIEAADVVLMSDRLETLPKAIMLARKSLNIIYGNIAFALIVKLIVLVLGAFGLAPMWLAVFADVGVTIITVIIASLILSMHRGIKIKL